MGQAPHPAPERLDTELAPRKQRRREGWLSIGQAEQIGGDAHLAIAVVTGADPDHRDGELHPEAGGQLRRHMLQHQGKTASRLQIEGGAAQALLADGIPGLAAIAEAMHRLGGEPQMAHHRDATAHQAIHHRNGFRFAALELHGGGRAVLEHPAGGSDGIVKAALIAQEGQIGDDQRLLGCRTPQAAADGAGMQDHLVKCDRQGGGVAKHDHGQGVPHQNHVGTGLLHQRRRESIPGGEHGDRPALLLVADKIRWSQGPFTTVPRAYC